MLGSFSNHSTKLTVVFMRAKDLCKVWDVKAAHALYRESGDWFHKLKRFPGVFFDKGGYVMFDTEFDYINCPGIQIKNDVHIKARISSLPKYKRFDNFNLPELDNIDSLKAGPEHYYEGEINEVLTNKYERNAKAKRACLKHFGTICFVCKTDYTKIYGFIAKDLIQVHHLIPLSTIGQRYSVDPIKDLIPLCPNCHCVAHKKDPAYTIEELQKMIKEQSVR